ncbi:MAG: epoxyqueuosine reductase QueH [Clostridiales bacterium]|nr:epoxyqueuosine reductase QueH [Clostridiales bacterium]
MAKSTHYSDLLEQGLNDITNDAAVVSFGPDVLRPAILLHSCCGPCSTAVVERLAPRFRITLYFCNSNIDDEAEYLRRLEGQKQFVESYNASGMGGQLELICAPYTPQAFLRLVQGTEGLEEGGARCRRCIYDRLEKTAEYAALHGYEYFSTTLSVSRHKSYEMVLEAGKALALRYGLAFEDGDYKKLGGEQRSAELARAYGLYRQDYCGCRFSMRAASQGDGGAKAASQGDDDEGRG